MNRFAYVARDGRGQQISGTVMGANPAAVSRQLRQEGKFLVRLDPQSDAGPARPPQDAPPVGRPDAETGESLFGAEVGLPGRISLGELIYLTNQLAVMTETGVPLADALDTMIAQSAPGRTRALLEDIAARVKGGEEFSAALARHPAVFAPMYVAMVRAAEASGALGTMLDRVAGYLADEQDIRRKVRGALIYPAVMMLFALGVTIFLMAVVLPRFSTIYASRGALLPLPTRALMALSNFVVDHWLVLVGGLGAAVALGVLWMRSERGRHWWANVRLGLPLVGSMLRKLYITRCLRTLGTLIGAGVSMLDSVRITRQVAGRGPFGRLWDAIDRDLRTGQQLSRTMLRDRLIPPSIAQMMSAGEQAGRLPQVMERVARFSEEELKAQIKTATALIEPVMIAAMGIVVGLVVLALLLPIFNVSSVVVHGG